MSAAIAVTPYAIFRSPYCCFTPHFIYHYAKIIISPYAAVMSTANIFHDIITLTLSFLSLCAVHAITIIIFIIITAPMLFIIDACRLLLLFTPRYTHIDYAISMLYIVAIASTCSPPLILSLLLLYRHYCLTLSFTLLLLPLLPCRYHTRLLLFERDITPRHFMPPPLLFFSFFFFAVHNMILHCHCRLRYVTP